MLRTQLEDVYGKNGLTLTDAVNVFFQQSLNAGGFPFEVNENNAEIIKAKAMARLIKIIYKHQAVLDIRQTQEYICLLYTSNLIRVENMIGIEHMFNPPH